MLLMKVHEKQNQQRQQDPMSDDFAMQAAFTRNEEMMQNLSIQGGQEQGPPEIDPTEISLSHEIGVGSFGKVYIGHCRQKSVAVKILHKQNFDKKTLLAFRREVKIMSKIFHPNICLFMGACTIPGNCMIVTEYLSKGDVESLLRNRQIDLSLITKMKMARDAALGMNWLHCSNPIFIHRDLKSSNLLVDENMNVKVCDFGLSQLIPRDKKIKDKQNAKGTPLWMAPEVMMFQEFDFRCDVYSFGIVLWEILTRDEPFAQYTSFDKFKEAVCINHERPPIPEDCLPSLRELITICWDKDTNRRPSFKDIISALDLIIVESAISDSLGQQFWKENFLKKEEVPWNIFIETFLKFIGVPNVEAQDINKRCLHAILAEKTKNLTEVANIEQFGKVLDWFGPLHVSSPKDLATENTILDKIRKLLLKSWFHGDISTSEAQVRLSGLPGGAFLVRFSTTHSGCFTISSLTQGNSSIRHQRVSYIAGKGLQYNGEYFNSLEDIIKDSKQLYIPAPGSKFQTLFSAQQSVVGYT